MYDAENYIVFIVTSYWSYGELTIAIEFAKQLKDKKYSPYFFIPPSHEAKIKQLSFKYSILIPNSKKINSILFEDCEHNYNPKLIILSDFINFETCEKYYGITRQDLEIFSGKVGTFDIYNWNHPERIMDVYGYKSQTVVNLTTDMYKFLLVPCPIVSSFGKSNNHDGRTFYYKLSGAESTFSYDEANKNSLRAELGLKENVPIILTTLASWQANYKDADNIRESIEFMDDVFFEQLSEVCKDGHIVVIGEKKINKQKNVIFIGNVDRSIFLKYAGAADLYVSRNITSTTVAQLALCGVPCLNIINSYKVLNGILIGNKDNIDENIIEVISNIRRIYKYRMFPVGWHTYLKQIVRDNLFFQLIPEIELFEKSCAEKLEYYLKSSEAKNKRNILKGQIVRSIDQLQSVNEILDQIVDKD